MNDLPSPDPPWQGPRARYRFTLPEHDFPDTTVEWWEAVDVPADAGSHVRFLDEDGAEIAAFAVGYAVMRMERFPDAELFAIRLPDGSMVPSLRILRDGATVGMVVPYIQEMIARYEAILPPVGTGDGAITKRLPTRRGWAGSPNAIEQAVTAIRDLEEQYDKVTDTDVISHLHTSRATFYRKLTDEGLQFDDIRRMAREEPPE